MVSQLPAGCKVTHGKFDALAPKIQEYVVEKASICQPSNIHIVDGSEEENEALVNLLIDEGVATKLKKHKNWWVNRFLL